MKKVSVVLLVLIAALMVSMIIQNQSPATVLGVTDGKLAAMPDSPNAVSSQTTVTEKLVEPLPFKATAEETRQAALAVLASMGGNEIKSQSDNYIHAVFTTSLMRYKDDVELYLDNETATLHFRSASRVGHGDMGVNRARYDQFRQDFLAQ